MAQADVWQDEPAEEDNEEYDFDHAYPEEVHSHKHLTQLIIPQVAASLDRTVMSRMGTASRSAIGSRAGRGPQLASRMGPVSRMGSVLETTPATARPVTSISAANYSRPQTGRGYDAGGRGDLTHCNADTQKALCW